MGIYILAGGTLPLTCCLFVLLGALPKTGACGFFIDYYISFFVFVILEECMYWLHQDMFWLLVLILICLITYLITSKTLFM